MDFLNEAINLAKKAQKRGEVPIGAVIVRNGRIIARAHNRRESAQNAIYHAEIVAIMRACKKLRSWRLDDCDMYVTLEPCQMCMGAIINARIKTVYFGARATTDLNWKPNIICTENAECSDMLKNFFAKKR